MDKRCGRPEMINGRIRDLYIKFIKSGLHISYNKKGKYTKGWSYILTKGGNMWKVYPKDVSTYNIINTYGVR